MLEDYLDSFRGAVIAVSHDRYFLDRITTHLFAFDNGVMKPYINGYQAWLDDRQAALESVQSAKPQTSEQRPAERRKGPSVPRFSFKEQRDFDTIDQTMADLEEQIAALDGEINRYATDYVKVTELTAEQERLKA